MSVTRGTHRLERLRAVLTEIAGPSPRSTRSTLDQLTDAVKWRQGIARDALARDDDEETADLHDLARLRRMLANLAVLARDGNPALPTAVIALHEAEDAVTREQEGQQP